MQSVKVIIETDRNGDTTTKFELEGFVGNECDSIAELEAQMGNVMSNKATDEAYQNELPNPLPNELAD